MHEGRRKRRRRGGGTQPGGGDTRREMTCGRREGNTGGGVGGGVGGGGMGAKKTGEIKRKKERDKGRKVEEERSGRWGGILKI